MKIKHDKNEGIYIVCWNDGKESRMIILPSPPPHKGFCVYDRKDQMLIVAGLPLARAKKMAKSMV